MTWSQSLNGRPIDLVRPTPADVDFREIAETLSRLNRYAGCAQVTVSVGFHTLIVIDAAPPAAKPYAALHDAHEARIGDLISPTKKALRAIAAAEFGSRSADEIEAVIETLKIRHDRAIWAAAGLPEPSTMIERDVIIADKRALMTERRWFLAKPPRPWPEEGFQPLPTRYRWRPPDRVADELFQRFCELLPALSGTPLRAA